MTPALEFDVFPSVLPLAYHGAIVALSTCVPAGLPRVRSSLPMRPHQSLPIPHLLHPFLLQCRHFRGPATVLYQKSVVHSRLFFP